MHIEEKRVKKRDRVKRANTMKKASLVDIFRIHTSLDVNSKSSGYGTHFECVFLLFGKF